MSDNLKEKISAVWRGDIQDDAATLAKYSHDASLFEVKPKVVVFPKNGADIAELVRFVAENKATDPTLSITPRAAGTCMSGGSLNESIILDVNKYMQGIVSLEAEVDPANEDIRASARVLPGTFYRDFEVETLKKGLILPCYTASKNLCAIGGMVGNNAAGEKTLRYGKMEHYVQELKMVFADGVERTVKPLTRSELEVKIERATENPTDFESNVYKQIFDLINAHQSEIEAARPKVSKNSAGYYLWNVWDPAANNGSGLFDLTKLVVGSQGTLGIVTEARLGLVPVKPVSKLFVIFMPNISKLGDIVNEILKFKPESVESYDDSTMKLALKFAPEMMKTMKTGNFFKLALSFLPELGMMITGGIPKLMLLVEFSGTEDDEVAIDEKMAELEKAIAHFGFTMRATRSVSEAEKYWTIRRESFNLLRKHVRGRRTAPFVDDVVVEPRHLPEFLPKMRAILDEYKLLYTIAGHAGNGNFHIIPLMDMKDARNRSVIREVSDKIYDLVAEYHGSITGEHNDGIVRTPYLGKMYEPNILNLFADVKKIFDPQNIFNPGKKVAGTTGASAGTVQYMEEHLVRG